MRINGAESLSSSSKSEAGEFYINRILIYNRFKEMRGPLFEFKFKKHVSICVYVNGNLQGRSPELNYIKLNILAMRNIIKSRSITL